MTVKTKPLWQMISGPAQIELRDTTHPVLGATFARLTIPVGKNHITFSATREFADAVQKLLSLEIVDYAE